MLRGRPNLNLARIFERNLLALSGPYKLKRTKELSKCKDSNEPKCAKKLSKRYSIDLTKHNIRYVGYPGKGEHPYRPYPGGYTSWRKYFK